MKMLSKTFFQTSTSGLMSTFLLCNYGVFELLSANVASKGYVFITAADFILGHICERQINVHIPQSEVTDTVQFTPRSSLFFALGRYYILLDNYTTVLSDSNDPLTFSLL